MNCFMAVLISLLVGSAQEDLDNLLRQLGDESADTRNRATERLIRLGEPARAAVRRATLSGGAEERLRAGEVLKTMDLYAELKPWYALDSRVTFSGETTLEKAARAIETQTGQRIEAESWPEGSLRINLQDAPFWIALETLCEADGSRSLTAGSDGPRLRGPRWVKPVSVVSGPFRVSGGSTTVRRDFDVDSRSGGATLTLGISLAWERTIMPVRSILNLDAVRDDQGNDLKPGFEEYQRRVFAGYFRGFEQEKRVYSRGFASTTSSPPPRGAKSVTIEGSVTVYVRGSEKNLEMAIPSPERKSIASLDQYDDRLKEKSTSTFSLSNFDRKKTVVQCTLQIEKIDARLVADLYNYLYLADKAGRRYQGTPTNWDVRSGGRTYGLEFRDLPESAELTGLFILLPVRMVRKEIPFSFSHIPLP